MLTIVENMPTMSSRISYPCDPALHKLIRDLNRGLKYCSVCLRHQKAVGVTFTHPYTQKRTTRIVTAGISALSINAAYSKALLLDEFFEEGDLGNIDQFIKETVQNKRKREPLYTCTIKAICTLIEGEYFSGINKNTGRKRSRENSSDLLSFETYYNRVFSRFEDKDALPSAESFAKVLATFKKGTKSYQSAHIVLKKMADLALEIGGIKVFIPEKVKKVPKVSYRKILDLEQYLQWHDLVIESLPETKVVSREAILNWLSAANFMLIYGVRPGEILAIGNLKSDVVFESVTIPKLPPTWSCDAPILIEDYGSLGHSTKTGSRLAIPMIQDEYILDKLYSPLSIHSRYSHDKDSFENLRNTFVISFGSALTRYKFPGKSPYDLRHLANQLGELYGIPQELRAKSLGHSTLMNESIYKARYSFKQSAESLLGFLS